MYSAYITVLEPPLPGQRGNSRLGRARLLKLVAREAPALAVMTDVATRVGAPVLRVRRDSAADIRAAVNATLHLLRATGYRWDAELTAGTEARLDADTATLAKAGK